jgi:hypothetical protein
LQKIKTLLGLSASEKIKNAQTCHSWVESINQAYRQLNRPDYSALDIVDLKLSVIFWRSRLLKLLLHSTPEWMPADRQITVKILTEINTFPSPLQQEKLSEILGARLMAGLLASFGIASIDHPELDQQAGPSVDLDIVANRGSSEPFEKWRENDRFSRYKFDQDGVHYRGVTFRPGDVLLANVNVDGNGVYTSLSEPRSFSSHSGFFAIFEHAGRRLPVVVETFEKGVRPVPLSIFLGPSFCSYVEVFRHRDYSSEQATAINLSAAGYIDSVRAYNFSTEDPDPEYMSCTSVGRFIHQDANLAPAQRISEVGHPVIQSNLASIGYQYSEYFGPVDFLLNECFRFEGVIDNNQVEQLVAREIIDREFKYRFESGTLVARRFPFPYRLNLWGLGHMRRQTWLGRIVSYFEGFTVDTLPRGPDELLAVILLLEKQVGQAIIKTRTSVNELVANLDHLHMESLMADDRIKNAVRANLILPWLEPHLDKEKAPLKPV